jgi:DNA-binding NarL/FixJ family response regulator
MRDLNAALRVLILDDSRTIQAMLDNAFSNRAGFRVVGFCSDPTIAAEMVRQLRPDIVTIDLLMPYIDGLGLLNLMRNLPDVCKIVVSDVPLKNIALSSKLIEAGAVACLGKSELIANDDLFFSKIHAAVAITKKIRDRARHPAVKVIDSKINGPADKAEEAVINYPIPVDEMARIRFLRQKGLCNSSRERQFDLITAHVAKVTAFPVCLLTFIDREVQWIKSAKGMEVDNTQRHEAFCNYTIAQGGPFVVSNATSDERFAGNPLVTGGLSIRCYAGHPVTVRGVQVGSLCVIDNRVRTVSKHVLDQLSGMAEIVAELIDQRPAMAA